MGCFGSKEAVVVKETVENAAETADEVAHEMMDNLTKPAPAGGGVNMQYDCTKSPEENAAQPPPADKKSNFKSKDSKRCATTLSGCICDHGRIPIER